MNIDSLSPMVRAYLECALWSSVGRNDAATVPLDMFFDIGDFSEKAIHEAISDCGNFREINKADIDRALVTEDLSQIGHSFWLSRNGHGAGFFDFKGKHWDNLQIAARNWKELYIATGDDGKLYFE